MLPVTHATAGSVIISVNQTIHIIIKAFFEWWIETFYEHLFDTEMHANLFLFLKYARLAVIFIYIYQQAKQQQS
jgi:hypothetical protein